MSCGGKHWYTGGMEEAVCLFYDVYICHVEMHIWMVSVRSCSDDISPIMFGFMRQFELQLKQCG